MSESPESPDRDQEAALADVGRSLLCSELEKHAGKLHVEFNRAARKASESDRVTEEDVRKLDGAMELAEIVVDHFHRACPEIDRRYTVRSLMTPEEIDDVLERDHPPAIEDTDE